MKFVSGRLHRLRVHSGAEMDVRFYRAWKPLHWIAAAAIILAAIDTFAVSISLTALGLLVVAALPWIIHLFRTIELPGGVKIEMRELEEATERLAEAGAIDWGSSPTSIPSIEVVPVVLGDRDPNLALAALRIDIERKLRALLFKKSIKHRASVRQMLAAAKNHGLVNESVYYSISDLLPILNNAVHGAEVPNEAVAYPVRSCRSTSGRWRVEG